MNRPLFYFPTCDTCGSPSRCDHDWPPQKSSVITADLGADFNNSSSTSIIEPQKILNVCNNHTNIPSSPMNNSTEHKAITAYPDTVFCNFCLHSVNMHYLTKHMLGHATDDKPVSRFRVASSTKLLPQSTSESTRTDNIEEEEKPSRSKEEILKFFDRKPDVKLREREIHSFRRIRDVSCLSSVTSDGRYSDFLISIWFIPSVSGVHGGYFGGHSSHNYFQHDRLNLHMIYDQEDRYFIFSAKLLRRSSFNSTDIEESAVSERICEQEDLCTELRRLMIFFNVPPRAIYKRFRKLMKEDMLTEVDENTGAVLFAYSPNHNKLLEATKNSAVSQIDSEDWEGCYGM